MGWNGLLVAVFQMPLAAALGGRRRLRVAAAGMVLGGVCMALLPVVPHPSAWAVLMTFYTVGEMMVVPQLTAFVADRAPAEARGSWLGIHGACSYNLAFALAPAVLLPLREAVGDGVYWPALLVVGVAPGVMVMRGLEREG